jgi:hypothetical protein
MHRKLFQPAARAGALSRQASLNSLGGYSLSASNIPSNMVQSSALPQSASTMHLRTMGDSSDVCDSGPFVQRNISHALFNRLQDTDDESRTNGDGIMMDMLRCVHGCRQLTAYLVMNRSSTDNPWHATDRGCGE